MLMNPENHLSFQIHLRAIFHYVKHFIFFDLEHWVQFFLKFGNIYLKLFYYKTNKCQQLRDKLWIPQMSE